MTIDEEQARAETLVKMAESRAEIRRLLEPPPPGDEASAANSTDDYVNNGEFPRSRTMRMLVSGRGLGAMGAVVGGVLLTRPALALRLLRLVPVGAVAKVLAVRALSTMRERQARRK